MFVSRDAKKKKFRIQEPLSFVQMIIELSSRNFADDYFIMSATYVILLLYCISNCVYIWQEHLAFGILKLSKIQTRHARLRTLFLNIMRIADGIFVVAYISKLICIRSRWRPIDRRVVNNVRLKCRIPHQRRHFEK